MNKTLLSLALVGATAVSLTQVEAASITDISVQLVGASYTPGLGGGFAMGGGTPFNVAYESDPSVGGFGNFTLSTLGMASVVSGNTITYTGAGSLSLFSGLGNFAATLQSLSMTLNAGGGFTGVGQFGNISESLAGDFTSSGGIANFGFSFNGTATSWTSAFGGISSAILSAQNPGTPGTSVPDGGITIAMLGLSVLSLGAGYRRISRS